MNRIPPPPGWEKVPCAHESKVLKQYLVLAASSARWCESITRGRMEYADALSEIQEAIVRAVRQYAATQSGAKIPGALVNVVIRREACKLLRHQRACGRNTTLYIEDAIRIPASEEHRVWIESKTDVLLDEDGTNPMEQVEQAELEAACAALAYALRRNLSPAAFAVLHLRHVEELTPDEISALAGKPRKMWRRRLDIVKEQARVVLAEFGIQEWDDIAETPLSEIHA